MLHCWLFTVADYTALGTWLQSELHWTSHVTLYTGDWWLLSMDDWGTSCIRLSRVHVC